ncbi:MAG: STAS domain-containing protein [Geobacter sp.]|nr:STAS domain-containing protein [Geobacter sp.]
MEKTFRVEHKRGDTLDSFTFHGNIDALAELCLRELPALVGRPAVTIDFSNAGRINSMGIALLLRCLKAIREEKKAEITLDGLNQMTSMLFKMTGVFLLATQAK